jgi:heptosyltransferase-2
MNIAVFCPNWVGDAVMATPALRALREHFRDAYLIGILKPYVAGVLEGSSWLDQILLLDRRGRQGERWPGVAARLRRLRPDLAVLFPNSFRSALVAWLGRCRRRVGYARYGRSLLLTDVLHAPRDPHGGWLPTPALDSYNRLAGLVGCTQLSCRMELFTTAADECAADAVWRRAGFDRYPEVVCLNPGAAFGSAKYWPAEAFASLAQEIADRRGSGILVLCGPGEQHLAQHIAALAGRSGVYTLAEHTQSLGLTKACIRRANLLITTDSGPRHFAAAFDRPVVTLFGPTHIAWTETYYPRAVHLQKKVPCGPCQLRVCPLDHRCMTQLTAGEVFIAAEQLLRTQPHPPARGERKAS